MVSDNPVSKTTIKWPPLRYLRKIALIYLVVAFSAGFAFVLVSLILGAAYG